MNKTRLTELTSRFAEKRILVVGDLMLDEFLWGKVSRISPEAPVPVVEVVKEEWFPGGAANVARNLATFSGRVSLMGVTGVCRHATHLKQLLTQEGIEVSPIQSHSDYQTIVKTRVIARQQHVVRIDREKKLRLLRPHLEAAISDLKTLIPAVDAVIIEDYGKGTLTQEFVTEIIRLANEHQKIVTVDPNPHNPLTWAGATVIKPNRSEAFSMAGQPYSDSSINPTEDVDLMNVGNVLMEKWGVNNLLITLGEHGVMLFRSDAPPHHAPTRAREVFDVSGAGDTVIALFTLALAAGATPPEAAEIANHASGVVVGKLGTATVTPDELIKSFEDL